MTAPLSPLPRIVAPRRLDIGRISAAVLIALIFAVLADVVFPTAALRYAARSLLVIYLLMEWPRIQRNGRIMLLIAGGLSVAVAGSLADPLDAVGRALDQGAFFAAFFANQFFLREPARTSPLVRRCASFFIDQAPSRRYGLLTMGGYLFGIILNLGVLSLLGLMIRRRNTLAAAGGNEEIRAIRERRMVLPVMRGFSTSPLASPMSLAMAVLLTMLPDLSWTSLLPLGFVTAMLLLLLGWILDRIEAPRHLAHLAPRPVSERDPAALAGIVAIVLSVFALAVGIEELADVALNRAVLVALPLAGLIWLGWQHRAFNGAVASRLVGRRLLREGARVFPRYRTEVAILSSAGFIGMIFSVLVPAEMLGTALSAMPLPYWLLPALGMALVIGPGLAGINPIVSVAIVASAFHAAPDLGAPPVVLAVALSAGWTLAMNSSPLTASALILGDLVNRSAREVTWVWNGRFTLIGFAVLSAWFALLTLLL